MKFPNNTFDTTPFHEQVQQLTNIYEQWNDCERTVIIFALSKRLPAANLKFLASSFDHHLRLSSSQRINHHEEVANSISFLYKITKKYSSLPATSSLTANDKLDTAYDHEASLDVKLLEDDTIARYSSKEEVLHDLLMYIPLLRATNDEGKKLYMQFVPQLIEDTMKYNFSVEFVQQIISYLLIHPVVKTEDRKILNQWQRQLEDHIVAAHFPSAGSNFNASFAPADSLSFTTSSISSASSSSSASSTTWPTVSQPIQPLPIGISLKTAKDQDIWDLKRFSSSQDFFDDVNPKYPTPIGINKNASVSSASSSNASKPSYANVFDAKDEHNISFSKNGKEVLDFEKDFPEIASTASKSSTASSNDFLTVPNMFNDHLFAYPDGYGTPWTNDDGGAVKTRRSNSLTTPTASSNFVTSSSAENLANLQNKPRSFSLTMDSSRNPLASSGSLTRLDDFNKMQQFKYSIPNSHIGMGHIGVWLKSLRLHKYFWLFTNMSYEQMMDITEEYLENLGVTKGARHKLVLCIQKLAERVPVLQQMEKELMEGAKPLKSFLDELTNIVVTPMRPINSVPNDEDVATHVMRVFDVVFQIVLSIKYHPSLDEDSLNAFMWLVDKALHHDAFQTQTAHLKEVKFRVQRLKMSFGGNGHKQAAHFAVNKSNNPNKMRWQNKPMPMKTPSPICDNQPKIHRKNSLPFYGNSGKSMGYNPPSNLLNYASGDKLNQYSMMHQQQQHNNQHYGQMQARSSHNTLMPYNPAQQQIRRNSSCGSDRSMSSQSFSQTLMQGEKRNLSDSGINASVSSSNSSTASDLLNSQLESLCRQMTESAIL